MSNRAKSYIAATFLSLVLWTAIIRVAVWSTDAVSPELDFYQTSSITK